MLIDVLFKSSQFSMQKSKKNEILSHIGRIYHVPGTLVLKLYCRLCENGNICVVYNPKNELYTVGSHVWDR